MAGDTAADVRSLVDQLVNAYSAKQVDRAVALFADEVRAGRSAIRSQVEGDLAQAEAVKAWYDDLEVSTRGDAAWLFALVTLEATVGQEIVTMPMRMPATTTPTEGRWQLRQVHFSMPFSEQAEGEAFGVTVVTDILELWRTALATAQHAIFDELYAPDALFDINVPEWRFQLHGPDAIRRPLHEWHPTAPDLVEWNSRSTPWGAVVESALWEGDHHELSSRSLHLLDLDGDHITRHVMYCTSDATRTAYERATAALIVH